MLASSDSLARFDRSNESCSSRSWRTVWGPAQPPSGDFREPVLQLAGVENRQAPLLAAISDEDVGDFAVQVPRDLRGFVLHLVGSFY